MFNRGIYGLLALLTLLGLLMNAATVAVFSTDPFTPTPDLPLHVVESDSPLVHPTGSWTAQNTPNASGGSYLYSSGATTDILELPFQGSRVEIVYLQHPDLGTFAIEIDSVVVRTVVATGETTIFGVRSVVDYLAEGEHILRVYPVSGVIVMDAFYTVPTELHGLGETPLTTPIALAITPAPTPIVYLADGNVLLRGLSPADTPEVLVSSGNATSPVWSPDSASILYIEDTSLKLLAQATAWTEIWSYDVAPLIPLEVDWGNGDKLAFTAENAGIYCMEITGFGPPTACDGSAADYSLLVAAPAHSPTWSPTGDELAYVSGDTLYVLELATETTEALLTATASSSIADLAWSPIEDDDESLIAFSYDLYNTTAQEPVADIWWINRLDPAAAHQVTSAPVYAPPNPLFDNWDRHVDYLAPSWSPDGTQLATQYNFYQTPCGPEAGCEPIYTLYPFLYIVDNYGGYSQYVLANGAAPDWAGLPCPQGGESIRLIKEDEFPGAPEWTYNVDLAYVGRIVDQDGLFIYESPAVNAAYLKTSAGEPEYLTWGSGHCAFARVVYETAYDKKATVSASPDPWVYRETWYRLSPPTSTTGNCRDEDLGSWILAGIQFDSSNPAMVPTPYIYLEHWDVSTDVMSADPLANLPSAPDFTNPPECIPFRYDRERVSAYARYHSLDNFENTASLTLGHTPQYPLGVRYRRATINDPFFANYASLLGQQHKTGSATFVSQSLWVGGLPMVNSFSGTVTLRPCTADNSYQDQTYGWRFCASEILEFDTLDTPTLADDLPLSYSSTRWNLHDGIYYSLYAFNGGDPYGTPKPIALVPWEENSEKLNPINEYIKFSADDFKDPASASIRELRNYLKDPAFVGDFIEIEIGDYLFIDSHVFDDDGDKINSHHGFVVVGWGPAKRCIEVFQERQRHSQMEPTGFLSPTQTATNFIPYVADFGLGEYQNTLRWQQYPGSRPFYCSRAKHQEDEQDDPKIMDGNSSWFGNTEVGWSFYQVTDDRNNLLYVDSHRIYAPNFDIQ